MQLSNIPLSCLFLSLGLQLLSAFPVQSGVLTNDDLDVLKLLLHRLEESIPDQKETRLPTDRSADVSFEDTALVQDDNVQPEARVNSEDVRDFFSARDLRTVRNDSNKRYSGCFGRRMDRIGSMTSLGCNTVSRLNPKWK